MPNEPDRKYVRVYYNDLIRDYPEVWADNDRLATWLRLLATADPMWPTPPELPRSVKQRIYDALVASSLVSDAGPGRFRMKGLDAERAMRSQSGRNAAASRWHGKGNATGNADPMPTKPNQTKAEQSTTDQPTARDPADIYWQLTGKYPTDKTLTWIDDLATRYGSEAVIRHLVGAQMADRAVNTLLGRTQDRLRAEARQLDKAERATEEAALRAKRAIPRKIEPWQEEFRKAVQKQYDDLDAA